MPKTVAVQSSVQSIAQLLREKGYRVVDMYDARRPGSKVDAYLYTTYHPDILSSCHSSLDEADISMGYTSMDFDHRTSPLMLNVTGMTAEQAVSTLEHRLGHKDRH